MQGQWPTHLINEDLCLVTKWFFLVFLEFFRGWMVDFSDQKQEERLWETILESRDKNLYFDM